MLRIVSPIVLITSLCNVQQILCANILITEDIASPSHQIWNYALADGLVSKGHNVTVLGPDSIPLEGHTFHRIVIEEEHDVRNTEAIVQVVDGSILHNFDVGETYTYLRTPLPSGLYSENNFESEQLYKDGRFGTIELMNGYTIFTCNHSLNSNGFRSLMNYPKDFKFDLMLFDVTMGYCFLPLIQRFNSPPSVGITALLLAPHLSEAFGNNYQSSYLPHILFRFSESMNVLERLQNYFWTKFEMLLKYVYYTPKTEAIARRAFGDDMLPLHTLLGQLSLLLCNLSPGFHYAQPLTPNIIPVGGLHINPAKKLPQNLQKIMDNAKNGVILFSLGSNLRSDTLRLEKRRALIDAFSKLNQTILWKFESQLTDLPENVIVRKWLPQTEILAHPNLKLFISHGGGLSTIEAAYFGKPVVGIPFFVDQYHNMELMVNRKLGIKLEYGTLTEDKLLSSIQEILLNPIYSEEGKKVSRIMRDQPETALERALFWTEYVMRHNGTHFLDPKSRYLSKFVSSSTDIHLFWIVLLCSLLYICCRIVSSIKFFLFSKQTKSKKE